MSIDAGRVKYLESMDLASLARRAHELLAKMTLGGEWIARLKVAVNRSSEAVEVEKARIVLSPAYRESGSNETIRGAWLVDQRTEDAEYARVLSLYRETVRDLESAEATLEATIAGYKLVVTEIRLATSQLAFLSE